MHSRTPRLSDAQSGARRAAVGAGAVPGHPLQVLHEGVAGQPAARGPHAGHRRRLCAARRTSAMKDFLA